MLYSAPEQEQAVHAGFIPMKRRIQCQISETAAGRNVLDYLAARFTYLPRDSWALNIRENRVLVNRTPAGPGYTLEPGDMLEFISRDTPEPPVNFHVRVLYADSDVMVVDKPANLPCHPAGRYFRHTLWAWLMEQGAGTPAIINRLDRETSGVLLVACNTRAESRCRRQFARRQVTKQYLAIVEGLFPTALTAAGWLINMPRPNLTRHRVFMTEEPAAPHKGEKAETAFERIARHDGLSLVRATPVTGRTHQIRATLHSLGFPVTGDKVYGLDAGMFPRFCTDALTNEDWLRLRVKRQALHSCLLEFRHPSDNRLLRFESPLPPELAALMQPTAGESPVIRTGPAAPHPDTSEANAPRSTTSHGP